MYKKILILTFTFLTALLIQAQKKSLLDYQEIQLGTCADGTPFLCHFIPTDGELKSFLITSDQPFMLIGDKRGNKLFNTETLEEIADLDFKNQKLSQIIPEGYLMYSPGKMFSFRYGQPAFFNFKGEKLWTCKDQMIMSDRPNKVVVCLGNNKGDRLNAYDMLTGKPLWQKTITGNKHSLWADIYIDKDDKRVGYLMGDSLIRLNFVTGDTLRHTFAAGVKESAKSKFSIAKVRNVLPSRDFMREAVSSGVHGSILTGTHSNMIFSGDSIFVADAEYLYCFDKNLNTLWTTDLPDQSGSKSRIKIYGDKICMQNYGIAFQNALVGRCGHPFTATYNRNTGKQISQEMLDIKKKVMGGLIINGRTYWQTDNELFYSDEGDDTVHEIKWKPNTPQSSLENHADYVLSDTIGIVKDGILQYVVTDKTQLIVEVYGQDINVVKADGSCERIPADSVYLHYAGNIYSTNNKGDNANTFVVLNPKTRKIEYTLHLRGKVSQDKAGNIYVCTKQGVGFHRKK